MQYVVINHNIHFPDVPENKPTLVQHGEETQEAEEHVGRETDNENEITNGQSDG